MLSKKILTVLAAASLTCLTAVNGWAQTAVVVTTTTATSNVTAGSSLSDDALVSRYTLLTGSKANAQSLVTGLRTGSVVTLVSTSSAPAVSFTPATQNMGYGNINIAIALAKTALAKQGITEPTTAELAAALNGVLTQRSSGMGWGQIAQTMGVKLGSVVSASKTDDDSQKDSTNKIADKDDKKDALSKSEDAKNLSAAGASVASNAKGSSASGSGSGSNGGGKK
jgi:hypothetical protein